MTTEPAYAYHPAMNELCRGVMDAVGHQPGDTAARSARREQMAADIMSSMRPHNPLETMLAGQCVMFDQVVRDATSDLLRGQTEEVKLRVRPQICGAGRMVLAFLAKLEQSQARTEAKLPAQPKATPAAAEPARPVAKPVQKPDPRPAPEPVTAPVQTRDPAPAGNDAAAPKPAEPTPELPSAARQPLPPSQLGKPRQRKSTTH
jgi:hypothetical protein